MIGKHAWQAQILSVIRYVLLLQHPSDLDEVTSREKAHHTPITAFRHLPPNSARFSYATVGALFISAQLSTDAVSALRKVWVLVRLWKQPSALART